MMAISGSIGNGYHKSEKQYKQGHTLRLLYKINLTLTANVIEMKNSNNVQYWPFQYVTVSIGRKRLFLYYFDLIVELFTEFL